MLWYKNAFSVRLSFGRASIGIIVNGQRYKVVKLCLCIQEFCSVDAIVPLLPSILEGSLNSSSLMDAGLAEVDGSSRHIPAGTLVLA